MIDHNQTFQKYNEVMVLASSKPKTFDSMPDGDLEQLKDFFNYQIEQIDLLLEEINYIITNYYKLQVDLELYELNGMENDLESLKKDYSLLVRDIGVNNTE